MLEMELSYEDGRVECRRFDLPIVVGRDEQCTLRVRSWRVGRQHARISERSGTLFVEDFGSLGGTYVNGRRVSEYGPLLTGDEIIVGPCRIQVLSVPVLAPEPTPHIPERGSSDRSCPVAPLHHHPARVAEPGMGVSPSQADTAEEGHAYEAHSFDATESDDVPSRRNVSPAMATAPMDPPRAQGGSPVGQSPVGGTPESGSDAAHLLNHRRRLHKALLDALDLRRRDILTLSDAALRQEATDVLAELLENDSRLPPNLDRAEILRQVVNEAVGLGPLEPLLDDRTTSEIMVNAFDDIYVERAGVLERHPATFSSEQAVLAVIDRIIAPLGRRIDESSPMVDARLRDGSRVNAVIPPIALRGPCLTIRKFPERRLDMSDLLAAGSLDTHMAAFLERCVQGRKSLVVSGGTGSGKTTLLNVLSNCIPQGERVITIEDAAELRLNHAHRVALEARPANAEGKGCVQIRDLVRNALRMRPDRIIVGECRGAEAFDMLAAMNTGHEGSLTTLHANTPRDALARLETMVLMAGMDLPLAAIRDHIASAVQIIVQQARLSDGCRLVTSIVEVTGIEGGRIQTQELFRFHGGTEARFEGCGVRPECFEDDRDCVPMSWLTQSTPVFQREANATW